MSTSKHIVITGVGGYLGSALAGWLSQRHVVIGYGHGRRFSELQNILPSRVHLIDADVRDEEKMRMAIHGADIVIHTAGPIVEHQILQDPSAAEAVIVDGARVVHDAARRIGATVLFCSTLAVYGTSDDGALFTEESEVHPISEYGRLKLAAENIFDTQKDIIIRFAHIYGYGNGLMPIHKKAADIFVERARSGKQLIVYGDGSEELDLIHIKDVVRLVERLIEITPCPTGIFNISSGVGVPVIELAKTVLDEYYGLLGKKIDIRFEPDPRNKMPKACVLANYKVRKYTRQFPSMALSQGIREMLMSQ